MPADEMQANVVYIFEGKVYQDRFLYTQALYNNIDPLMLDVYAGHIVNLGNPIDYIGEACGLYVKSHACPKHYGNRILCYKLLDFIATHFESERGVPTRGNYIPSQADILEWRRMGSVLELPRLLRAHDRVTHLRARGPRSIIDLYYVCVKQFFDPTHPSKINADDLKELAVPTLRQIYFQTADGTTLRRLREVAKTGSVDVTQIVSIFIGRGVDGRFSFFYVCSAHDRTDKAIVMRLMLAVARDLSFSLLEPNRRVVFSEQISHTGYVARFKTVYFRKKLHTAQYRACLLSHAGIRFAQNLIPEHKSIHNEFVRYALPVFYYPASCR